MLVVFTASAQNVQVFGNRDNYLGAVLPQGVIHFTEVPNQSFLSDQYIAQGVEFVEGTDFVDNDAAFLTDGIGLRGGQFVGGSGATITIKFDSPTTSVAADFPGSLLYRLFHDGVVVYQSPTFGGSGRGHFAGLIADTPFDTVQFYDGDGLVNIDTLYYGELTQNTPPVAEAGGPYLVAIGQSIVLDPSGSTDEDGDTLTADWTITDATGVEVGQINGNEYMAGEVPGIYEVTLVVNDGEDDSLLPATTTVVVYDPSGGFVTGGGWIDSPPGAIPNDWTQVGKANFGFVSKYKKGANVPTGQTQFQFKARDLNFHSDSYQWLVVNQGGTNAQFKGNGTINGDNASTGDAFKFMLWAGDDNPDTFRIKIWYDDGAEVPVYDNGLQGTNQTIGGGSIVVHTGKKK